MSMVKFMAELVAWCTIILYPINGTLESGADFR